MCVDPSWRKPKGIDNRVRRRFKGQIAMPSVRDHPLHITMLHSLASRGKKGIVESVIGSLRLVATGNHTLEECNRSLTAYVRITDRLWLQQEDAPHDALGPQGLPRPEPSRRRPPPDAQQDLRR